MSAHQHLPLFRWALEQEASRPAKAELVDLAVFRETSARWKMKILPNEIPADLAFDRCGGLEPQPAVLRFDRRA
ncbi:hypothetical protein [Bosea sp. 685]|uniref:hypothetical protein n=1 Tax=Bosea sp. 685 TaxID=3080057 RepID=UPI002892CE92|nr:hypothetical protein [Bosea sp. 685]WNJ93023.1 hypothetical protein RMR04_12335 [Bosea sp. 685]